MEKQSFFELYGDIFDKESFPLMVQEASEFALCNGISMTSTKWPADTIVQLPFSVMPTEFPQKWYDQVYELQPYINYVLHTISYSKEILKNCLLRKLSWEIIGDTLFQSVVEYDFQQSKKYCSTIITIEADDFTWNIYQIFENVFDSQSEQPSLGLFRSDYLLDCNNAGDIKSIKQVETNTMSVGFGGIAPKLRDLYLYITRRSKCGDFENQMPENLSCTKIAYGMIAAWNLYRNKNAVILFVVEKSTFNICDQRAIEFEIKKLKEDIEVIRCTFEDLRSSLTVANNRIFVNDKEIAVVYYRVGYAPEHYEEEDWQTRLKLEKSVAVKCPSVGLHLAGTKRIQLYLSQKGVLEKFVPFEVAEKLRGVFANQYLLSLDKEGNRIFSKAIKNPELFVLKPEREGGGNNFYGDEMKEFLKSMQPKERNSYILMDRINPPKTLNCIVRGNDNPEFCHITSELGIFGVILGNKDKVFENYAAGQILRSKPIQLDEGGVAAGYGAVDYPYLL